MKRSGRPFYLFLSTYLYHLLIAQVTAQAALSPLRLSAGRTKRLVQSSTSPISMQRLDVIRQRVSDLEQSLLDGVRLQSNIRNQVYKIKELQKLQMQERDLGKKRLAELESTLKMLQERKSHLAEQMKTQQQSIRRSLTAIDASNREEFVDEATSIHLPEREKTEAPRRKVLSLLVDRGVKDIEILRADLSDAVQLEARIQEERQQLTYLVHDLKEQEGVLELNRQLQFDYLKKKQKERLEQLANYRKLKSSEAQVEQLIGEFNARVELERSIEAERKIASGLSNELAKDLANAEANSLLKNRAAGSAPMSGLGNPTTLTGILQDGLPGPFALQKGKMPFPIPHGRVTGLFGRAFDPRSGLFVFKKGIDITSGKQAPVRAISAGKVVYSGKLPDYGQVVIIDHGEHFYSLCAHLGKIVKKTSEAVVVGDLVGSTDELGTPLYFEIRARNVAVNPLQWIYK